MKPKICVYAIALNEEKHVDRFMSGCKDADLVVVCDTGSTDNTAHRLRELGATVHTIQVKPWRFDVARNLALSTVPQDMDVCLTVDLDEVLQPGWREGIEAAWTRNPELNRLRYNYVWNWKADGSPDTQFRADRWHSRHGYQWRHPCHETVYWCGEGIEKVEDTTSVLHHHADNTKPRSQYLPLLEIAVKEDPLNDRMQHYYARELYFYGQHEKSIAEFENHLALNPRSWNEERAASYSYMSKAYRSLGNHQQSVFHAIKATMECEYTREPWLEVARAAHIRQDWHTCYWAATKCLSIKAKTLSYIADDAAWGHEPYDYAALSGHFLGHHQQALTLGLKALELKPDDVRLQNNVVFYTQLVEQETK